MPPFAGSPDDLEGLVQFILWSSEEHPPNWSVNADPQNLSQIATWLEEAGTEPGDFKQNYKRREASR